MTNLRWVSAVFVVLVCSFFGFPLVLLATQRLLGSASHLSCMVIATLAAVYFGALTAPQRDRFTATMAFSGLLVAIPVLFLTIGALENRRVTHGVEDLLGSVIGAAIAIKITPKRF